MARKTVVVPHIPCKKRPNTKVSYEEILAEFKRNADHIPAVVTAMKKADYDGWEQFIRDLAKYFETNPKLKRFIRVKDLNGQEALSIGEPNWVFVAVVLSFAAGYAVGTACVKLGPCNFAR